MHDSLQELCAAFIENRETVKRVFKMESNYIYPICANVFCARGVRASEESLKDCKTLLKQKTGVFSTFRGYLTAPICCMLAAGRGPETRIEQALENYQALKEHFWSSQYLALSAFLLADMGVGQSALDCVERGRRLYDRMKKEHPFLTSAEDCVYAVLMAFSDKGDDALIADMEACYQLIRKRFLSANSAQSVSHVLSLSPGTPEEKTDRLFRLFDGLREAGAKYGKDYRLSTLAAVSVLDGEPEYQAWLDSGGAAEIPGGESIGTFRKRAWNGFMEAVASAARKGADTLYLVVHGGTIMAVMSSLTGKDYFDFNAPNGAGYIIDLETDDAGNVTASTTYDRFCGGLRAGSDGWRPPRYTPSDRMDR